MKLGVLTVPLGGLSLDEACRYLSERGVQMVEIGCGGYPGKAHCNPKTLLADEKALADFLVTSDHVELMIHEPLTAYPYRYRYLRDGNFN